jgi:hypothetical protein
MTILLYLSLNFSSLKLLPNLPFLSRTPQLLIQSQILYQTQSMIYEPHLGSVGCPGMGAHSPSVLQQKQGSPVVRRIKD